MKKKILLGSLMIILILSISSCDDNKFLQETPKTFFTLDNVFTSSAQVDQALISLYYYHRDLEVNATAQMLFWKGNGTDVMENSYNNIGSSMDNYVAFTASHSTISSLYNYFYSFIAKANLVMYAANLPQISWASEADKTYVIAQARFFRAWAYCNLAELWGGVPLVTEVLNSPKYDFKRETATAVYQYAIDELLAIENDLPVTTIVGGRIVRGAAQHFLCELYLGLGIQLAADGNTAEAQNAYTNSISYGDKVIDGGTYSLMTSRFGTRKTESSVVIDIYKNGVFKPSEKVDTLQFTPNYYWDLFQEGNQNYQEGNKECIWALQTDYDAYKKEDSYARLSYTRVYGCDMSYGTKKLV